MKYAVLILAHKNIEQILLLVKTLSSANCDIFIHFNRLLKVSEYHLKELSNLNGGRVFVLPNKNRVVIEYHSCGMTEAILEISKYAYKIGMENYRHYSYYCFISGQDFPIKSNNYIESFLNQNYPKPFIDIHPWHKDNWAYHKFKKIYFGKPRTFIRSKLGKLTFKPIGKIIRAPIELPVIAIENLLTSILGSPAEILQKGKYDLYGGSPWWILPDDIIKYIIETSNDSYLYKIMRFTKTPDETFIQSLVMNSPFKDRFDIYDAHDPAQYSMTFLVFSDTRRPIVTGHPYNFDIEDYALLLSKHHLFARKFDIYFDREIVAKLMLHLGCQQ